MAVTQMFGDSLMQATFAGSTGGNTMVVISLRGGIDGLGVVVPHGDAGYYSSRPTTAVREVVPALRRLDVRAAPQDGTAAEVLAVRRARRGPGRRPARRQPLALLRDRGGRGRRARLLGALGLDQPDDRDGLDPRPDQRRAARQQLPDHRSQRGRAHAGRQRPRRPAALGAGRQLRHAAVHLARHRLGRGERPPGQRHETGGRPVEGARQDPGRHARQPRRRTPRSGTPPLRRAR